MRPARFARLRRVLDRRQPDLTVLMEGVHKPHNFSAILRTCDAVGVLEAHVVPAENGFTVYRSSSAGAAKWISVHKHDSLAAALTALRGKGLQRVAAHPAPRGVDYRDVDYTGPLALMVGAELTGLSPEALAAADILVRVPMEGMGRSLNVSVATALFLFEARRQREDAGMYGSSRLDREEHGKILFEWAYPRLARSCRSRGEPYPGLAEDGSIVRPSLCLKDSSRPS